MSDTIKTAGTLRAAPGIGCATLPSAFQETAAARSGLPALTAFGTDQELTWDEYAEAVARFAAGLAALGIGKGDTVAIMLPNCPEFHIVDMAALHLGATPFSVYLTSAPEQITYLFGNAGNTVLVAAQQYLAAVGAADTPRLTHIVVTDAQPEAELPATVGGARVLTTTQLTQCAVEGFDFERTWRAVTPSDLATIIYTSGTTGDPKGVELTHANLMFVMHTCNLRFPFEAEGAAISYLPTAHAADRVFSHYLSCVTGWPITTVGTAAAVFDAVAHARPSWFLGVPRIWEKLRAALRSGFEALPPQARAATENGLESASAAVRLRQSGGAVSPESAAELSALDEAVFAPLRRRLGLDRVALLMTGAAPIAPAVHEFFLALGLPLQEGFGMSETGALGFTNVPGDIRIGKVGLAQPGTEVTLAPDGELLLRGPHVMRGYRRDPAKTAEAIDQHGWLHTGDIARIDEDGWVSIIDRKKELIINAAGKNMSPANIENTVKSASPLIGQVCVIGDRRPYNVALIVLDPAAARALVAADGARSEGGAATEMAELISDTRVIAAVDTAIQQANSRLSRVEQVKSYRLLASEWLADSAELTPTMKLKRRGIAEKYAEVIADIYRSSAR